MRQHLSRVIYYSALTCDDLLPIEIRDSRVLDILSLIIFSLIFSDFLQNFAASSNPKHIQLN